MLISESDVMKSDFEAILDEAVELNEDEAVTKIKAIPVVENSRLGAAVVSIDNLSSIVEDYGCDYEDAFCAIAEENQIDPDALAVSVEDWKLIETPELVDLVPNIVVKPISEDSDEYGLVEGCFEAFLESGDDAYFYPIFGILEGNEEKSEAVADDASKKDGAFSRLKANPRKVAAGVGGAAVGAATVAALYRRYAANKNKPGFAAKMLAAIKQLAAKVIPGSQEHSKLRQLANVIKNHKAATAAGVAGVAAGTGAFLGRKRIAAAVNNRGKNEQPPVEQ